MLVAVATAAVCNPTAAESVLGISWSGRLESAQECHGLVFLSSGSIHNLDPTRTPGKVGGKPLQTHPSIGHGLMALLLCIPSSHVQIDGRIQGTPDKGVWLLAKQNSTPPPWTMMDRGKTRLPAAHGFTSWQRSGAGRRLRRGWAALAVTLHRPLQFGDCIESAAE